jgi:hypothetical protein
MTLKYAKFSTKVANTDITVIRNQGHWADKELLMEVTSSADPDLKIWIIYLNADKYAAIKSHVSKLNRFNKLTAEARIEELFLGLAKRIKNQKLEAPAEHNITGEQPIIIITDEEHIISNASPVTLSNEYYYVTTAEPGRTNG